MLYLNYMKSFKEFKKKMLKDPQFKKRYEELDPEFKEISLMIKKRIDAGLTQKELARRTGTKQSAISRFENGKGNPTLQSLYRIADALGLKMKITLEKNH